MSMNQSRLVQSNLWQETTSLWDTPAVHLYTAQHHKQRNSGGKIYCSCQGRNMFPFYNFSGREDHTNASLFPSLLLTRLNLSALSSAPVSFPSVHTLKGFPGDCVPLLSWDRCTTELHRLCPKCYKFPHCEDKQSVRQTGFGSQHHHSASSLVPVKTSRRKRPVCTESDWQLEGLALLFQKSDIKILIQLEIHLSLFNDTYYRAHISLIKKSPYKLTFFSAEIPQCSCRSKLTLMPSQFFFYIPKSEYI